jgi:hypothetical protein
MFRHCGIGSLGEIGKLAALMVIGAYTELYTRGSPPASDCGVNANVDINIRKTMSMAIALYSLPTLRRLRLDFAAAWELDSLISVKNGLTKPITPIAISRANAGANKTSNRTIELAKYRVVTPKTSKNMFLTVGFLMAKYRPVRKNSMLIPSS